MSPITYCGEFIQNIPKNEKFTLNDLHYTADSLRAVYSCSLDNRKYEVLVKPLEEDHG